MINNLYLGAGAMKAGTTWLYSQLLDHPDLYFSPEKEVHFIDAYFNKSNVLSIQNRLQKTKDSLSNNAHRQYPGYVHLINWYRLYLDKELDFSWYANLFSLNRGKKMNCDFSNLTCQIEENDWLVIKSLVKNLKVTYVLRDPVNRLWSHLKFHHQYAGLKMDFELWSVSDFKEYIEKPFIQVNSEYDKWNKIMQSTLSEDQYKVFYFEDFIHQPIETLKKLENFLGVSAHDYQLDKIKNKVNASVKKNMPDNFMIASRPFISKEIEAMDRSGMEIHKLWKTNI